MIARDRKRGIWFVMITCLLLLVTACGGQATGNTTGGTAGTGASQGVDAGNAQTAEPGKEQTQPLQEATRKISTVKGEVEIPVHPQRVVALYYHHQLLALGLKPVGANLTWWGGSPYLTEQEQGIVDVGGPPSLEAVSALKPDLIIMNDNNSEDYEQWSKIAPAVLIPYDPQRNVYEDAKLVADIIGKSDIADTLLATFEEKSAAARASMEGVVKPGAKAAIIRIEGKGGQFGAFGANYGRGGWPIYEGLKLQMVPKIKEEMEKQGKGLLQELSFELLPEYVGDADYIFVSDEGESLETIKDNPLWNSLPAVKNGQVIELEKASYFYFDPISIEGQLDSIANKLLEVH